MKLDDAKKQLQQQKLDDALKATEFSLKGLDRAEFLYRESMRDSSDHNDVSKNQSILIADRKKAEELKKKIEDLKKAQQVFRQAG